MIRIDYKFDGHGNVYTTWVLSEGDSSSMMGRLLFSESDFNQVMKAFDFDFDLDCVFEEKH